MTTPPSARDIDDFWQWFQDHRLAFEALNGPADPFWDIALKQLKRLDDGLWFELSGLPPPRELIITVEGNIGLFALVERIVARAPAVHGWQFIALKPPMGFTFTTTYEGHLFDGRQMWFLPLKSASNPDCLGLQVGVVDLRPENHRHARNAVAIILETALGERLAAQQVLVDVVLLPETHGYIELRELPAFLAWRATRSPPRPEV